MFVHQDYEKEIEKDKDIHFDTFSVEMHLSMRMSMRTSSLKQTFMLFKVEMCTIDST